jgi:dihydropteroate synthase
MVAETTNPRVWRIARGSLELGKRTLLMGVVNVTPDSFSDGGKYFGPDAAVEHALRLQEETANLIDIGGESTRPGSEPVSDREQLRRLLPVLSSLQGRLRIPISIDTTSAVVARECLSAGAAIINDVTGFHGDGALPEVCHEFDSGVVLMHILGTPRSMQREPRYHDLLGEVNAYLVDGMRIARTARIAHESVVVDPGIGFGKTFEQNYRLLGDLMRFRDIAAGVLVGPSRKAFTGEFNMLPAAERQFSTAAAVAIAVLHGADIVRVHDVNEMRQVTDIVNRFQAVQHDERIESANR